MTFSQIDIKRVESSPTEPVTLAQAKAQLIVTSSDDDAKITELITQCRRSVENYAFVSMVAKTITLTADFNGEWELPYGPVNSITSVFKRTTPTGSGPVSYSADPGQWTVDGDEFKTFSPAYSNWASIPVANANQWMRPERYPYWLEYANRYKIIYTAGPYAPEDLVLAILNEIAFRYEQRGDEVEIRPTISAELGLCPAAQRLCELHRRNCWI